MTRSNHVEVRFLDAAPEPGQPYVDFAPHQARRHLVGLIGLILLVFAPAVPGQFIRGDSLRLSNPAWRTWHGGLRSIWTTSSPTPLADTFLLAQVKLFPQRPGMFRATSLALHTANVLLLWQLLRCLRVRPGAATAAAAVVAILPVHVELIATSSRQGVLDATLFCLAGAALYCGRIDADVDDLPARRPFMPVAACMLAAMLCHATGLAFPLVAAMAAWRRGRLRRDDSAMLGLSGIAIAGLVYLTFVATPRPSIAMIDAYLAVLLLSAGGVVAAAYLLPHRTMRVVAAASIVAIMGSLTGMRGADFRSDAAIADALVRRDPDSSAARVRLGRLQLDQHSPHQAIVQFQLALQIDPGNRDALLGIAHAHASRSDLAKAAMYCRQLLAQFPDDPDAHLQLGVLHARQGRSEEAIEHLRHALRLRPRDIDTLLELAAVLAERGDAHAALEQLTLAAETASRDPRPLIESARIAFQHEHDIDRAVTLLERARRLDPSRPDTVLLAAAIQFEVARLRAADPGAPPQRVREAFHTAELLCREAVRLAPESPLALLNLGKALAARSAHCAAAAESIELLGEAILCFERSARLDPDDPEPPRLRAQAFRAREALRVR